MRAPLLATALVLPLLSPSGAAQGPLGAACAQGLRDQTDPGSCIQASSIPLPGTLLPLGPELFVAPGGEVGVGTTAPAYRLDVAGEARVSGRAAFGNQATIGPVGPVGKVWDFSHLLTDFTGPNQWRAFRSLVEVEPPFDLTGPDARYIEGHDLSIRTTPHDKDLEYVTGAYLGAFKQDSGTCGIFGGPLFVAQAFAGHVVELFGSYSVSLGDGNSTVDQNYAMSCVSGHWGGGGSVVEDFSFYVFTPETVSPLARHYGIYLEDQEVATDESYALYSDGGDVFFRGDVGVGEDQPAAALHVAGDFVATGTKSFAQQHPEDQSRQIWFVCLEGNEAGTYFRGSAELVGGRAVIPVPEDFRLVTEAEGLTVQLTPLGRAALWVEAKGLGEVVVRGDADVSFDYFVNGVRRGYADFETIRAEPHPGVAPKRPTRFEGGVRERLRQRAE